MNQTRNRAAFGLGIVAMFALLTVVGCSTVPESTKGTAGQQMGIDVRFAEGKTAFDQGHYLDAIRIFEDIRIQSPTSDVAAEATFLEGLSRFKEELYSGAAVNFRAVRRNYPSSPLCPRAQYMIGESYYHLSPRADLDQTYSNYAVAEFQNFLHDYPTSAPSLVDSAQKRIADVRNKMANKVFLAGDLYTKIMENKSAMVYYDRVLELYYDSEYAPEAELRVAEIQLNRKKYDECRTALEKFDAKYLPSANPEQRQRALAMKANLP